MSEVDAVNIQHLIQKARALLPQPSPLLRKNTEAFIHAAMEETKPMSSLLSDWSDLESHRQSLTVVKGGRTLEERIRRLAVTLMCVLLADYSDADKTQLDQVLLDGLILIYNLDDSGLEFKSTREQDILEPVEELLLDLAYVERRFRTAAARLRLLDLLSLQEQCELVEQDRRTIDKISGFDETCSKFAGVLKACLQERYATLSSLPAAHSTNTNVAVLYRKGNKSSKSSQRKSFSERQSSSTSVEYGPRTFS